MAGEKILVVEDDGEIGRLLRECLEKENWRVHWAASAAEGRGALESFRPDVVLLDVMLPDGDGLSLCREWRSAGRVPILMVSARGEDLDRIVGLEVGADDYLAKPFHPKELVARVRALLRRCALEGQSSNSQGLEVRTAARRAFVLGQELVLTPIEFGLLNQFVQNPGKVHSRQELLDKVWGPEYAGDERTVDAHIRNLRSKLREKDPHFERIQSVWGVGYRFD
jgi:DNA-binding response OmpR family regulator